MHFSLPPVTGEEYTDAAILRNIVRNDESYELPKNVMSIEIIRFMIL